MYSPAEQLEIVLGPGARLPGHPPDKMRTRTHADEVTLMRELYRADAALLILDADRPESLTLVKKIRCERSLQDLPILFAESATAPQGERARSLLAGVTDCILSTDDADMVHTKVIALATLYRKLKRMECQLSHDHLLGSVQFLDSLIENLPDMIFVKDAVDLRFVRFNRAGEQLLGFDRGDLIGKNDFDFFPVEQADVFTANDRAVLESGHLLDISEEPIQTKNGPRFLHTKKIPLYDAEGKPSYLLGISEDITARKFAEAERLQLIKEQLARSEAEKTIERLSVLSDAMPMIVWTAEPDGAIDYYNRRWYEYTGLNASESLGWQWQTAIDPEQANEFIERWRDAVSTGATFEHQLLLRNQTGVYRWFMARSLPHKNTAGEITKWYGTCADIEVQMQTQARIESLVRDLRRAVSARDEFLSVASHELKTPITSLKLQTQMAKRSLERESKAWEGSARLGAMVDTSLRQIDRLVALIDDLLDVSRIEAGRLAFNFVEVDMVSLLQVVVSRLEGQLQAAACEIVWGPLEPCLVKCDRSRIEQVVVNLLTNTIKYAAANPVEISLHVRNGRVQISVKDHGIGIDPCKQAKIFERFERAISSENISGLGLGLYIAKQIVVGHRGEVFVESIPGQGSTFVVELPVDCASLECGYPVAPARL